MGLSQQDAIRTVKMVRVLITLQRWIDNPLIENPAEFLQSLLNNLDIQHMLQVNRYQDVIWYSKEGFDDFMNCLLASVVFEPDATDPYTSV